jgi:hypothetical protein
MKKIVLILTSVLLISCSTPQNPESWMEQQKNACLPTAIAFKKGLDRQSIWSEVLRYEYTDLNTNKKSGHAIVAYMYPTGKNQLWTYDYLGSYRIRAYKDDPIQVARESIFVRGNRNHNVYFAEYLK